jgi:hypothetical protein
MQTIIKNIHCRAVRVYFALAMVALFSVAISSCSDDEDPKPTITSISPEQAEVGGAVTITGTNLAETFEVKFNGITAVITSKSATSVVATVPAATTTGKITLKTPAGEATSPGDFTLVIPPAAIASFSPATGEVGTAVTITGTNLADVTAVDFNGTAATITSKTATSIVTSVPEGATSGKISVTAPTGKVTSSASFTVAVPTPEVLISDFEEADADAIWGVSVDPADIMVSAIESESGGNSFYHLKAKDTQPDYWVGGRYFEHNIDTPLGVEESDRTKVWMNVDVRAHNAKSVGKLVYTVVEAGAANNRRNYEIDFDVTWSEWKTISIRADKFGYWNGSGMTDAVTGGANLPTIWSVALYVQGGNATDVYDLDFDNLKFSTGAPLGEAIDGHH